MGLRFQPTTPKQFLFSLPFSMTSIFSAPPPPSPTFPSIRSSNPTSTARSLIITSSSPFNPSRSDHQNSFSILSSNIKSYEDPSFNTNNSSSSSFDLIPISINNNNLVNNLPKPLTTAELSPAPLHGFTLRVAYHGIQGAPGAYSEPVTPKA